MHAVLPQPRDLVIPSFLYAVTCFLAAECLYAVRLALDPPPYTFATETWAKSFAFLGAVTVICCLGGLLGLSLLVGSIPASQRTHIKAGVLLGLIESAFFLSSTHGEDRLLLRAVFVALTSVAIAVIVRIYVRRSDRGSEGA